MSTTETLDLDARLHNAICASIEADIAAEAIPLDLDERLHNAICSAIEATWATEEAAATARTMAVAARFIATARTSGYPIRFHRQVGN